MADPFVAEIRMFPFNFAPSGWAFCNGQLLPLSQNTALFSLVGTFYGGDGKSTFALPDMQGNAPVHQGDGAGLSQRFVGEQSGSEFVTLLATEMPAHNHQVVGRSSLGNQQLPGTRAWGGSSVSKQYANVAPDTTMNFQALGITGASLPHNNRQPYLTVSFCIALQGVFPPRS